MATESRSKLILKIIIPVAIGIGMVVWLFGREFNIETLREIKLTPTAAVGLGLALVALFGRDFGMAWRFHTLSDMRLSWQSSAKVTMLCEFTSAITPTSVGGSALSMVFMNREGIKLGRATAITLTTLVLDEGFFMVFCPMLFFVISPDRLFGFAHGAAAHDLQVLFWIVYGVISLIAITLYIGIFRSPRTIALILSKIFSLPVLKRWKKDVEELNDSLLITSAELRDKPLRWWIAPAMATIVSWLSRFAVVNALMFAFIPETDQITVLGRQFIVWALLTFTPTPGGSGVSEMLFKTYYSDIVFGPMLMVLAIVWRIFTYYVYLLIGFCMIPTLLKHKK
ncbi:MAG: flippase-like domain-containing protein [Muribaculaceae bacterium]|nr:flippase-like domain-containing protein [Muribaculaceae bacterium]